MIAPPHYKCECVTLEKVAGIEKLEKALEIIEHEIKAKNGTFKLVNKPQVIGAKDDKDIIEIMDKMNDDEDGSGDEDNEEGMGDIDIEDEDDDGEEKKTKTKKAADDDEEEKDGGSDDEDA